MPEFQKLCELMFDGFVKNIITVEGCRHYHNSNQNKTTIKEKFLHQDYKWSYLINESEIKTLKNTLLVLKVFNRFANDQNIRVKDAIRIFKEYAFEI